MNKNPSPGPGPPPSCRYLRVHELARLRNVLFSPRRSVRGLYTGRHTSRQRGHCAEFNDYREYTPGDEVSDIDWKAYGRSDRLYIKLFEHQADMTVSLLVDASASMGYTGVIEGPSKYDQACLMAGAIAFLTIRQRDRVGFSVAQDDPTHMLPSRTLEPRGGFAHLNHLLDVMEKFKPTGRAYLAKTLELLGRKTPKKSLLVLFSDLMEDQDAVMLALSKFTSRGGEAIVFHVLHEDELHLPDLAEAVFIDSETGRRVRVNVPEVRQTYLERINKYTNKWRGALTACGVDYQLVSTGTHYHEAIRDYLFTRSGRG